MTFLVFAVLDLADKEVAEFFSKHQFFTAIATEALLLIGVYLFIERFLDARQDKRSRRVAEPSLREIRTMGGELRRSVDHHVMDLPERHASGEEVEAVRAGLTPRVNAFDRTLAANRPVLTASPALVAYLVPAERMRADARLFLEI